MPSYAVEFNFKISWKYSNVSAPRTCGLRRSAFNSYYGMRHWFDIGVGGIFDQYIGSFPSQHSKEIG